MKVIMLPKEGSKWSPLCPPGRSTSCPANSFKTTVNI